MEKEIQEMFVALNKQLTDVVELVREVQASSDKVLEVVEELSEKLLPYNE